jgi:hypothetical protein
VNGHLCCDPTATWTIACLFFICALFCVFFLIRHFQRDRESNERSWLTDFGFWIFLFIWLVYRGVLMVISFQYSDISFRVFCIAIADSLYLIPMSLAVLVIFEHLAAFTELRPRIVFLMRVIFFATVIVIATIGISLATVDWGSENAEAPVLLWRGCGFLLVSFFVALPALALLKRLTRLAFLGDEGCLCKSKTCIILFCGTYFCRAIYDIAQFWDGNEIEKWLASQVESNGMIRPEGQALSFVAILLLELFGSVLAMWGVDILHKDRRRRDASASLVFDN